MATKGSTYAQDTPDGTRKHREHIKEMADAAKARRAKKGRGNGKRYLYNGVKSIRPVEVQAMRGHAILAAHDQYGRPVNV